MSFKQLVQQTEIKTNSDKDRYSTQGYNIILTENDFRERFELDPAHIWYTPSISQSCLYFNKETLAAHTFPIELFIYGKGLSKDSFYNSIQNVEKDVSQKEFTSSLLSLPDAMRLEYFELLVKKYGLDIPNLYEMFFENYRLVDYGFNHIDAPILDVILSSKTVKDVQKTESVLQDLPDKIKIYRGGNTESTPYEKAYSWTLDINIANFFASRMGTGSGYIVEGEVFKKDVLEAFLDDTDEKEIFVEPRKIHILSKIEIQGQDILTNIFPKVVPIYHYYRDKMYSLDFAQESDVHGYGHEARVLLMSLTIAQLLNLSKQDKSVLAAAAIFHDTQRDNDDEDAVHGKVSREYYHKVSPAPDPLVEFLCEYHCLPDEAGYREIEENPILRKNSARARKLFEVFKDADALDRVRFGIKSLDLKQLRLPVSRGLTSIARMYLNQIEVDVPEKHKNNYLSSNRVHLQKDSLDEQIKSASSFVKNAHSSDKSTIKETPLERK